MTPRRWHLCAWHTVGTQNTRAKPPAELRQRAVCSPSRPRWPWPREAQLGGGPGSVVKSHLGQEEEAFRRQVRRHSQDLASIDSP